jgi:hypothetical protein
LQQTNLILSVHFTNNSFIYIRLIIFSGVKCFWKIDAWGDRVVIKGIGCDLGEWFWLKNHTIWQHWKIGIVKSDSIHHFLENASTKSGTLQFPPFSGCELWIDHFVYDGSCLSLPTNTSVFGNDVITRI